MAQPRSFKAPLVLIVLTTLVGGCSMLGNLNPFSRDEILPGERVSALPQTAIQITGGTPAIGSPIAFVDWSQPGGNAANAPGNIGYSTSAAAAAWRIRAVGSASRRNVRPSVPPLVHGGQIFVYDTDGVVTALSAGGGQGWSASLAPEGERSRAAGGGIAASGSMIFAATGYGEVIALDATTGGRIWTFRMNAPAHSAPTAAGGKVFVVSATNVLYAIDQANGAVAWQSPGIPETAGVLSAASPAVSGSTVVVPYSSGEVIAFDTASGDLKWTDAVIRSSRTLAISGLTDVAASPVIYDGVVYATGVSGRTIAVNLASGARIWEQNIGSITTPAVSGNALFLVDLEEHMVAVNRTDGDVFWRVELPTVQKRRFFSVWTGPTLVGGTLWAVSNDKRMMGVDAATGQIVADITLPSPAYVRPIATSGQMLVLAADGSLSAY